MHSPTAPPPLHLPLTEEKIDSTYCNLFYEKKKRLSIKIARQNDPHYNFSIVAATRFACQL